MISIDQVKGAHDRAESLLTRADLEKALDKMALEIAQELGDDEFLMLPVMVGGIIPAGHLATRLNVPFEMDYIHATRYDGGTEGGEIQWVAKPRRPIKGRNVLIVEDILDGGQTLTEVINYCKAQGAKRVYTAVVIDKKRPRNPDYLQTADFTGVEIDDHFVYGFGLDYYEYLRNVFGVYVVAPDDMSGGK